MLIKLGLGSRVSGLERGFATQRGHSHRSLLVNSSSSSSSKLGLGSGVSGLGRGFAAQRGLCHRSLLVKPIKNENEG